MATVNIALPSEMRESLKEALREIMCTAVMVVMCLGKIVIIVILVNRFPFMEPAIRGVAYLAVASFVCMIPLYYTSTSVSGYSMFRVFACALMFIEAASLFLMLGVFKKGDWVFIEIGYLMAMCLLLTAIERLFEEKKKRREEAARLTEVFVAPVYGADHHTDEAEADAEEEEENFWRRIAICRSRTY